MDTAFIGLTSFRRITIAKKLAHGRRECATGIMPTAVSLSNAPPTATPSSVMGLSGSVPAYDTNFRKGFGTAIFGESSLMRIGRFYRENAEVIERPRVPTLDFDASAETDRRYPRAKVINMIFFIEGGATA